MPTPEARTPARSLHPQFVTKNGKRAFVVPPYGEFISVRELLADAEDLADLRAAKAEGGDEPSLSLDEAKDELGL